MSAGLSDRRRSRLNQTMTGCAEDPAMLPRVQVLAHCRVAVI
jgi:hypothetical protein